jgi:hypothetical protein
MKLKLKRNNGDPHINADKKGLPPAQPQVQ